MWNFELWTVKIELNFVWNLPLCSLLPVLLPAPNSTLSSRLDPFRSLVDPLFTSSSLLLTSTGAEQRCCWSCTGLPRHPPFDSSRERHLLPLLHLPQALVALLPGQTAWNQRCTAGHHGCSAPSFGPRVDPLPPAVPGLIQAVVSTPILSSTSPNSRPSFSPPEQSSSRAPEVAAMAVWGWPYSTPSPVLGVTKKEPPDSPLSPHAFSFKNGGRECHPHGAQWARAHCNGDQGPRAAIRVSPGGFLQCHRLIGIVF